MRILHVLEQSLPNFSGYAFRSDYIVRMQQRLGLEPVVVTSPKHHNSRAPCETLGGVSHHRVSWPSFYVLPQPRFVPFLKHWAYVAALASRVTSLAASLRADVIHAHSPSLNGLAAARAARLLRLPLVYELRYYEEDAAVDLGKTRKDSWRYLLARRLEWQALRSADRVVTISSALRADLAARGLPAGQVFEVPNGVDTEFFQPLPPDPELTARYALAGKTVVGFIGKFFPWEGLDCLVDAMLLLLRDRSDVKLLLAGLGEMESRLRARVPAHWRDSFVFAGQVPHDEVCRYYSVMDIVAYPRIRSRLTELTTPLKPLEAMAMERVVLGSDLGGIRELLRDGETGFLVEPGNPGALAGRIAQLAAAPDLRREVGRRARAAVVREREWLRVAARYVDVYASCQSSVNPVPEAVHALLPQGRAHR